MKFVRSAVCSFAFIAVALAAAVPALAQQQTPPIGSPAATRPIDGKQLPAPQPKFGSDTLTGVNDADYQPPFDFTGTLHKLTIKVDRPQLTPDDIKKLQAAQAQAGE